MSVQTNLRSALEQLLGSIQNGMGSSASSTVLCRHAAVEALAGTTKYGCEEHEEIVGREQPASLHADMAEKWWKPCRRAISSPRSGRNGFSWLGRLPFAATRPGSPSAPRRGRHLRSPSPRQARAVVGRVREAPRGEFLNTTSDPASGKTARRGALASRDPSSRTLADETPSTLTTKRKNVTNHPLFHAHPPRDPPHPRQG